MPSRKAFKKSISTMQPEPIPPPQVVFSTLPTTQNDSTPADNKPDEPSLIPDGYASSSRGAVFVDLNTNRLTSKSQSTGIQLEKDSNTFLGTKTSPRRCDLLSVSTPFIDIPETELAELVEARKLENGLDEADLELIGLSVPSISGSLDSPRSVAKRIMNGLTDLVIHTEKPLKSLDIVGSSKELISSIQESVIELDLPCEQPNYSIKDLCGIEDDEDAQSSTRILSIALAAVANDGDPGSEFVVKKPSTAALKLSGKSIRFVTTMKSSSVGKKTTSKSAENPNNASSQNSMRSYSKASSRKKTTPQSIGRTQVSSNLTDSSRYQIPVTAISDRWDDLDEVVNYAERVVAKFSQYDNFDLARQGKPVKSKASVRGAVSVSNVSTRGSTSTPAISTSQSGKSGRSASRASTVGFSRSSSGKAGSSNKSSTSTTKNSSTKSTAGKASSSVNSTATSSIKNSTESSITRASIIISRLCAAVSNILRREMMLVRANNLGLTSAGKTDKVTAFTRSLISTKASVSGLSLLNVGSSCTGKIVSTHVDDKKSVILLEPKRFSNQKKTYTGAYENLVIPAVKFPGNNVPLTSYVESLRAEVINPVDQLLNIMLVDVANDMTPTVVLRTVFSEVQSALSSLEEILSQNGGGVANEQIIELICMNLYSNPNFKRRSKRVIFEKFLNPDQQFSFDGSSGSVSSSISNPDSKTKIKMKTTADGKTTETVSQVETKDQTNEDDDSTSSPGDFASDLLEVRETIRGQTYSGYNDEAAAARAGTLTFQSRTSEMLDLFGKSGDSPTLSQAVNNAVEKLLEACKSSIGKSLLSEDEKTLQETGLPVSSLTFMIFDLVSEVCRSFYFLYLYKDTGASNYEGTSAEDPSFTVTMKSPKSEKGDLQNPSESFTSDVANAVAESTGALLNVREIASGSKVLQAVAKEIQEYENDIRDHYARVFALNEIFDTVYQSFDEFRGLLTQGDVGFARQQLSSKQETIKTIELLNKKILADSRWRFDKRIRSIFDKTYVTTQHELDGIRHFFRNRSSIVTDDVIGDSKNSLLCSVGIPFGMSVASSNEPTSDNFLNEVSISKRDIEFQGLIFEQQKFLFDPTMKVIVKPLSLADTFQTLVERRTQYFTFNNGNWQLVKYQDAINRIVANTGLTNNDATQILRNHVIDFMAKCFLRYVSMAEYDCDRLYASQKRVSLTAPSLVLSINSKLPIAPAGTSISNFLKLATNGYTVSTGPHSIDGANESEARLMYRLLQDPAFSGEFLTNEIFGTLPYEDIYCVVVDPDTFEVRTDSAVPTASYNATIEALGEVTSIKDPGDSIVISTKNGKFMRQRDQIRRFSGSEISATCSIVLPSKVKMKPKTSKLLTKTGKFGFKTPGRRS